MIDHYRLLRLLGRGGAGIVFEAEDMLVGRRVAIKLIPHRSKADTVTPTLLREVRLARAVQDPHVVSLYAMGTYQRGHYLVMELVEGQSVQAMLRSGPMPWPEATVILEAACDGVMAVHDRGIIHRDIKPANLLRSSEGIVKLTDFGLADWLKPRKRSVTGKRLAGTPHYMSPEQCRGEEDDERTDIYSLGATYHTLLTGGMPYPDAPPLRIMFDHCSAPVPDLRKHHREIPTVCAEIVQRAMAKKRADRYDSVREMQQALRVCFSGGRWRGGSEATTREPVSHLDALAVGH